MVSGFSTVTRYVRVKTPGKVNLQLLVGPMRSDGYHELATVFQAVSIFDEVTITSVEKENRVTVSGSVDTDTVPLDESNLVCKAAALLTQHTGVEEPVAFHIHKNIPATAGMGGGSADAAAALVGLDSLWNLGLAKQELLELAAELGSDVPFSLLGGTAIGTGRGDELVSVLTRGKLHWVFVLSEHTLSTPQVYRTFDELKAAQDRHSSATAPVISEKLLKALTSGETERVARMLSNDLQAAAVTLLPELGATVEYGLEQGALAGMVSGSGPTVAFLVESAEHAMKLALALTTLGSMRVVRAYGSVPGARTIVNV